MEKYFLMTETDSENSAEKSLESKEKERRGERE
jgi:hypothetical protein